MIIPEDILTTVVKSMDQIDGKTVHFHYGNKDELNRYLDTYKDQVYPLIWMLPFEEQHSVNLVNGNVRFIVAVNFDKKDLQRLNNERIKWSFKDLLLPTVDEFLERVSRNRNASFDNTDFSLRKYPNYRESKTDSEADNLHLWDALTLSLNNMSFYNKC